MSKLSRKLNGPTHVTLEEDRLETEQRKQLVDRLLAESRTAELMHLVLVLVVSVLFWNTVSRLALLTWVFAVAGAVLVRALVRRRLASKSLETDYALTNIRRVVLLSALAWATGLGVLTGSLQISELAILMVIFAGLVAGATSTLLADARSFYYFASGMLGPFFVAILVSGQTRLHLVAAILVVLFAYTMVVTFRRSHRQLLRYLNTSRQLKISEIEAKRGLGFLEAVLASAPSAVATLDAGGSVLGVNPAFERLFGYTANEAAGKNIHELIVAESERESARELDSQVRTGKVVVADVPRKAKDGTTVWVQASAAQVRDDVGHGAWFVMYDDITGRKELAEERLTAQRTAEEAARAKASFLANMSHEIRTPMNGVLGMLELLRDTDLDKHQRQSIELAATSAESLLGILNDILDFSKIDAGQLELEAILFDLHETVSTAAKVLTVPASNRNNELNVDIESDVPEFVLGDPGRLRQVVTNLLSNAIKFTEKGAILLSVSKSGERNGLQLVRISVRDTGIGIPAERLDSIFEEFTQADVSVTRTHGGTGLGLSISRKLVEQMGGELIVESQEGIGSEFSFVVPLADASDRAPEFRKVTERIRLAGHRFLVVDDSETARRIVREALETQGATVDEAACTNRALSLMRERVNADAPYDVVITDTVMPDGDGFELAAKVGADPKLTGTRLLMLSSAAEVEGRKKAREYGIKAYLTKPASRTELVEAAQALLGLRGRGDGVERRLITSDSLVNTRPKATVLLAEDNITNQQIAVAVLTKRGHDVDVAETGLEVLEKVKSRHYDVVLMDIQMPQMDGLEATREIRKLPRFQQLPIVALTAHALAEERGRCVSAGMNHFVTKPFKPHELHDAVERWLRPPGNTRDEISEATLPGHQVTREGPPVNVDRFRSAMAEAGAEDLVPEAVAAFVAEAPGKFAALSDAVNCGRGPEIAQTAHALKSSSGAINAESLAQQLQQLEDAGERADTQVARKLLDVIRPEFERVLEYLQAL